MLPFFSVVDLAVLFKVFLHEYSFPNLNIRFFALFLVSICFLFSFFFFFFCFFVVFFALDFAFSSFHRKCSSICFPELVHSAEESSFSVHIETSGVLR